MPDFSFSSPAPYSPFSMSGNYPTFSGIMGQSPGDLLSLINSLKQSNAQQNYGFQSNLMDKGISGQKDLANLGYASEANLQGARLGEAGRQFDVSATFGREQEANKYKQLADLLANQKVNEGHDRWLQDQQRWDVLRASAPQITKRLPRQPNVNAASFSDRLNYNNEIGDWLAQSGRLKGFNSGVVQQPSYTRRY